MTTKDQLDSWDVGALTGIADALLARRRALLAVEDELRASAPPQTWVGADADAAQATHRGLVERLGAQTAELGSVITAVDTAAATLQTAQADLRSGLATARRNGMRVSSTGAVTPTRSHDTQDEVIRDAVLARDLADQITGALARAAVADDELAAALNTAQQSDPDTAPSLTQQFATDFGDRSADEQADYLMEHPEQAAELLPLASEEAREQVGERVGERLDEFAHDPSAASDPERLRELIAQLEAYGTDPDVASSMLDTVGADGYVAALDAIDTALPGAQDDRPLTLATRLQESLAAASSDDDFDAETYARTFVELATGTASDEATAAFVDEFGIGVGGRDLVSFVLRGTGYSDAFVRSTAAAVDAWVQFNPGDRFLMSQGGLGTSELDPNAVPDTIDVLTPLWGQLADHPEVAREFFEVPGRPDRYFTALTYERQGDLAALTDLITVATTQTDGSPEAAAAAGLLASAFVLNVSANAAFGSDIDPVFSTALGHFFSNQVDGLNYLARGVTTTPPAIDPGDLYGLGVEEVVPIFGADAVNRLLVAAMSSETGAAELALGFSQDRLENLTSAQALTDPEDRETAIQDVIKFSTRTNGMLTEAVSQADIASAANADARVGLWFSLLAGAVTVGTGAAIYGPAAAVGAELVVDLVSGGMTTNAAAARSLADASAEVAFKASTVDSYISLVEAGVITPTPQVQEILDPLGTGTLSTSHLQVSDLDNFTLAHTKGVLDQLGLNEEDLQTLFDETYRADH